MSTFFRNAMLYRLTQAITVEHHELEQRAHREPGNNEASTVGFVAPYGTELCMPVQYGMGYATVVALKKSERILPGAVVREALAKKVAEIEERDSRKVYKKERDTLKDDIVMALLPQAFIRHRVTYALILNDLIIVDTSSANQAEDLLSILRECLGSLPCRPVSVKIAPTASMTDWVRAGIPPNGLSISDSCVLRDTGEEGGIVHLKRQDLGSDEVQQHLSAGMVVSQLDLHWHDNLSFTLDDKLYIKRIRFDDLLHDQVSEDGGDDAASQIQATYAIMAGTFAGFVEDLLNALGGEDKPKGI